MTRATPPARNAASIAASSPTRTASRPRDFGEPMDPGPEEDVVRNEQNLPGHREPPNAPILDFRRRPARFRPPWKTRGEDRLKLRDRQPLFVGTQDGQPGPPPPRVDHRDATEKYFSHEDTTFLTICQLGEDEYVGKVIDERLSTERVDDIRRNVLSILQRLCPETRFPAVLDILPCEVPGSRSGRRGSATGIEPRSGG